MITMDVTIQVDDAAFERFNALCDKLGIVAGDLIEGIVAGAVKAVLDAATGVPDRPK